MVRVDDRFYILATAAMSDDRPRVLKQGESFAVFDHHGDVRPVGLAEEGLYHEDTRHLSAMVLRLGSRRPLFLNSTVREDHALLSVDLTNPDVMNGPDVALARGSVHVLRTKFLWCATCFERIRLCNYSRQPVRLDLALQFAADFLDVFEVRGMRRERRGRLLPPEIADGRVVLGYEGLDGRRRATALDFTPRPARLDAAEARFEIELDPGAETAVEVAVRCRRDEGARRSRLGYGAALGAAQRRLDALAGRACRIRTSLTPA